MCINIQEKLEEDDFVEIVNKNKEVEKKDDDLDIDYVEYMKVKANDLDKVNSPKE